LGARVVKNPSARVAGVASEAREGFLEPGEDGGANAEFVAPFVIFVLVRLSSAALNAY